MKKLILFSILALAAAPAFADTGLVMTNPVAGQPASVSTTRAWVRPAAGLFVLSYPTAGGTPSWTDANLQYREWSSIPATYGIITCPSDISAGSFTANDPCGDGAKPVIAKSAVVLGVPPVISPTGVVTLTWTPPTTNTDGTTLADLKGFYVYQGTSQATLVKLATNLNAGARTLQLPLPVGTFYFGVSAYSPTGEGPMSGVVSVVVEKPAPIPTKPGAPTQFKATVTITVP